MRRPQGKHITGRNHPKFDVFYAAIPMAQIVPPCDQHS
jgi:hypothetical protein